MVSFNRSQTPSIYLMMISTRRFCGSRTPGPVGTSRCVSPKPWMVIALSGTPSLTNSASTALARRIDRPWLYFGRARGVGVAVHLDPRVLHLGRVGCRFGDDLSRTIGQGRLVPIEEHQIGAGRRLSRYCCGWRRWGWWLVEVVAQTNHQGMIEVIAQLRIAEGDRAGGSGLSSNVVFARSDAEEAIFGRECQSRHTVDRHRAAKDELVSNRTIGVIGGDAGEKSVGAIICRGGEALQLRPLPADADADIRREVGYPVDQCNPPKRWSYRTAR